MKKFSVLVFLLMALSTAAMAQSQGSDGWSWKSFKEKVVQKISTFIQSFYEPEKKENQGQTPANTSPQSAPAAQPQEPPAVTSQPVAAPEKPVAQKPAQEPRAQEPRVQEPLVTQTAPTQDVGGGASIPVSQESAQQKSLFQRFKSWIVGLGSMSTAPTGEDQSVPEASRIQNAASSVKSINPTRVASPAVPFKDQNLIFGHNDIPVFQFKKFEAEVLKVRIRRVPLLNPGREEILDSNHFKVVSIPPYPLIKFVPTERLETPEVASSGAFKTMLGEEVVPAKNTEKIEIPILEAAKKVTGEKIAKITYKLNPEMPWTALPVVIYTEEDLKLLRALILFEKKDQCHIAAGIFSDLLNSSRAEVAESSHFHLGICLHEMNLPTEALRHLVKTMRSSNKTFAEGSVKAATEDLQLQYLDPVVEGLMTVGSEVYPKDSLPLINYLKAKYYIRKGQANKALDAALLVPEKTPSYYKAQYVAAVAEYELGKVAASLDRQKARALELSKNGKDKDILTLFEMNLGREAFQQGKYKDSLDAYQKVPKENSLWIQSLMEEAWVQLQSKDMAGAVGNMHSIQSPYFNGVYKPESYVVRAIAYLNICQYADAFKSIAYLEHFYQPWFDKLAKYNSTHSSTQAYDTVIKQLETKKNVDVDELPFQVIREAARQRDFLNAQESVNQLIDENSGYAFVRNLIEKDRRSLLERRNATIVKAAQLREKIRRVNSIPDGMKNFNAWRFELANLEDFLTVYEFKVKTLREGLDGLNKMAPAAQARIAENRDKMKGKAGQLIKGHLVKIAKELRQSLDNDELLKYEVYAGSGENLRYKIAGGKTGGSSNMSDRKPAGMHWDFDGEYWEDEIGNYRSSLKNNCQNVAASQKGK